MEDRGHEGSTGRTWWVEWPDGHGMRRVQLAGRLTVGRSRQSDIVVDDMYVSRDHCVLELDGDDVRVDASRSVNRILVNGQLLDSACFTEPGIFTIGETTFTLTTTGDADEATRLLARPSPGARDGKAPGASDAALRFSYRRSTRELFGPDGSLIAQFSPQEGATFGAIVDSYPDAASTARISTAVWSEPGYETYLIHRILQRIRRRMGDHAAVIENVRGAGYRSREPIELR
jgi:hypothetical protein